MSLITILTITFLCALAAAAVSDSIKPFKLPEMDPSDPDVYFRAYSSALNRYGSRPWLSAAPTAMQTGVSTTSTTKSDTRAVITFIKLANYMFLILLKYSLYLFLLRMTIRFLLVRGTRWRFRERAHATAQVIALIIGAGLRGCFNLFVLLIHIFRAATQNRWVLYTGRAVGDRFVRTWQAIFYVIDRIWHHRLRDIMYMHHQQITNWFGRHKFRLIIFLVGSHFLSSAFLGGNNKKTELFMKWSELQRYIDTPLPEYLLRYRFEDGSNCHYQPGLERSISVAPIASMPFEYTAGSSARVGKTETQQTETGLVVEISAPPTTSMLPEEATALLDQVTEMENEQIRPGLADRISARQISTILLEEDALPSTKVYETENRQKLPGGKVAFCRQCRQEHCCEVYIQL